MYYFSVTAFKINGNVKDGSGSFKRGTFTVILKVQFIVTFSIDNKRDFAFTSFQRCILDLYSKAL